MKITSVILFLLPLLLHTACQTTAQPHSTSSAAQTSTIDLVDSIAENCELEVEEEESEPTRSLNDIRFDGWSNEDWYDNDYIRELRSYIDAYSRGAIDDEQLNALQRYKSLMKSRFVVYDISPYLFGGVWMLIGFVDNPKPIFQAWVYSEVDAADRIVGYEVRHFSFSEQETDFTKEHVLRTVEKHPELKLW